LAVAVRVLPITQTPVPVAVADFAITTVLPLVPELHIKSLLALAVRPVLPGQTHPVEIVGLMVHQLERRLFGLVEALEVLLLHLVAAREEQALLLVARSVGVTAVRAVIDLLPQLLVAVAAQGDILVMAALVVQVVQALRALEVVAVAVAVAVPWLQVVAAV
jgi:hypothetical protein